MRTLPFLRRSPALGVLLVSLFSMAGCSEPEQLEFAESNETAFMAACSSASEDTVLYVRICQCVLDTAQARLRFTEFDEIEAELTAEVVDGEDPPPLPDSIVEIMAECVLREAEL